jgi:putative endopeptidase
MSWGFDQKNIDKHVRPQDDFYQYANGTWLRKTKIPPSESRWGSFIVLRYETDTQLKAIIADLLKNKKAKVGSPEQLVRDVYLSAVDMKARNHLGIGPLAPLRLLVRDVKTKKDLLAVIARLHVLGVSAGWGAFVSQDSKESSRYLLHLWQGGLGMPERDYYLLDKPEQKRVRHAYEAHIIEILKLAGFKTTEVKGMQEVIMKIETALAKASMKKEDMRDAEKTYHKLSLTQLQKLSPGIDWSAYFTRTHAPGVKTLMVGQPAFFQALSRLLNTISLEEWKIYLEWQLINDASSLLSSRFVRENFNYSAVLTGQKKMRPLWRRALSATGVVGESLGSLYVKRYFPESSKRRMNELVSDLFAVYEERMQALDWMSAATKRKAVSKLRAMSRKIGYPTKLETYKGLIIDPNDYFGNILRAEEWHHRDEMHKLGKPVDRNEWHMTPQTVNAYCNFSLNEIVFPAAILQWPFFSPTADQAVNYAGIGSVIGHEMTHGFDDQGSKFDGSGNMKGWWTKKDRELFNKKARILIHQYDAFTVSDEVHVNGKLTLGENIADQGGLAIAWDAYQKHLARVGRKTIGGFSPEQRFFFGFAQVERELSRPEFTKTQVLTDPHSPAEYRINGPLSNFEPFHRIFNIKEGDGLYRAKKDRAQIW